MVKLFDHSIVDEFLFRARCFCQEIPVPLVENFLGPNLIQRIHDKAIEFGSSNRTYCVRPSCASFIPTDLIQDEIATCPPCSECTCSLCKEAAHAGDCPQELGIQ